MDSSDDLRSPDDVDADAERFVGIDEPDEEISALVDQAPDGSVADVIDQHREVPLDDLD